MKKKTNNTATLSKRLQRQQEKLLNKINYTQRFEENFNSGLNDEQVKKRIEEGLINKKKKVVTKTYLKMVYDNFFPILNIFIYFLAVLVIIAGSNYYSQLTFLGVILCNSIIGFIQDIRARRLVDKLSIINKSTIVVIRNGEERQINANELVLDDIICLKNGDQIPADCLIIKGKCSVNEAMLTGEPDSIRKKVNDEILSGTYVTSGTCYARVEKIGILNKADVIQAKASTFNKPKSEILRSLGTLFKVIVVVVLLFFILTFLSYYFAYVQNSSGLESFWSWFVDYKEGHRYISGFIGSMVSMIPSGLFLLTSVTLSVGVLTLAKKRCLVQELYCIEMLARTDCLCLDKTGTITDGSMSLSEVIRIDKTFSTQRIGELISSLIYATKDNNFTAKALINKFGNEQHFVSDKFLAFSSETKCSAAYFDKIGTIVIGAYGYIKLNNKKEIDPLIKKYSSKGYRCLIVGYTKSKIEGDKLPKEFSCIAILLLEDHIRDDAPETLKWFSENGVEIKVISGDDPRTVSEIAKKAGIKNFEDYISLDGISIEEVKKIATKYTIFGRVSPEQKEALVIALKEAKKTVAMTGDGVNDILALKRADCSIAMNSGSDAAKNISHLVLLDSNFSVLPSVVAEGRRVINNLQRTSSLFLSKTLFTMFVTLISVIAVFISKDINMRFPLSVSNFYIWEVAFIGVGGFFLALEPNAHKIGGRFINNAIKKAIPVSIIISILILSFYTIYIINYYDHSLFLLGNPYMRPVEDEFNQMLLNSFQGISAIIMAIIGCVSFIKVCQPLNKYRTFVVGGILIFTCVILLGSFLIPFGDIETKNYAVLTQLSDGTYDVYTESIVRQPSFGGWYFGFEFYWLSITDWLWLFSFTSLGIFGYFLLDRYININSFYERSEAAFIRFKEKRKNKKNRNIQ